MEPPSTSRVLVLNDSGRRLRTEALKQTILTCLAEAGLPSGELSVRLTSDEEIRLLNRNHRGIDETTDVLTFPSDEFPHGPRAKKPLGDIAIAAGQAERQALARGISFDNEVAFLAIHGVLHLSGLDDETDEQRTIMLAEMDRLGALAGLPKVRNWHTLAPSKEAAR